jgi:hypothetical protein
VLEATRKLLLVLALSALWSQPVSAQLSPPKRVFTVTAATVAGRLRAMGRPGDFALRNGAATAIVRKSDGWLVDFWPNTATDATAPQLAGTTAIDGLWQLHPTLGTGSAGFNLTGKSVRATDSAVEASAVLSLGAGTLRVTTSYELDGESPRLLVTTRFEHIGGGKVMGLSLGDAIKWGNTDYFVEGFGRTPATFSGAGKWVGRRGACGDLILRTLEPNPMRIHYRMRHEGLAAEINVVHANRTLAPGQATSVRRALEYAPIAESPKRVATGTLELSVRDENGQPLAAKLGFRGLPPTPDPSFGNDGGLSGAGRFVWSGTGDFRRELPVGRYRVLATAGIERDAAQWTINVGADETLRREGRLPRVIQTPGWLSADLHLHQAASVDADISYEARLIAVAAEGVELAVATDHYVVTDLRPTLQALRTSGRLATPVLTMVGSEVSTVGRRFGHFGLFPLKPGDEIDYENTNPKRLFADMRRVAPDAIIQVNHPRWDEIGYFSRYRMDPKSARIPLVHKNEFDPSFDAIEVYNGYDAWSPPKIRQVMLDWIRLLGQGRRYTATGNSDSHKLFYVDPGLPRNLIRWGAARSDAEDFRASEAELVAAIKAGKVLVTSGPIIDVDVAGKGPGETASGSPKQLLNLRVRAAPWIDVSEVEVLVGGDARRVRFIAVPPSSQVLRLDTRVELRVASRTFVVVVARGARDLPNVYSPKVRPLAFTNPIWLEP